MTFPAQYGPDSLLQLFGDSITDGISLTEYKNWQVGITPPRQTMVECRICKTPTIAMVKADGVIISGGICSACTELERVRKENEELYGQRAQAHRKRWGRGN